MKADRNPYLRPCLSALGITALVGIFSAVYEHFGHGCLLYTSDAADY